MWNFSNGGGWEIVNGEQESPASLRVSGTIKDLGVTKVMPLMGWRKRVEKVKVTMLHLLSTRLPESVT